jgi:hypothetical protein
MALHRDIYWVGRQWAVTGYGIQACNQKQKSKFDIEGSRLWEDDVLESIRAEPWLNIEDFEKALAVARKHYPEPPRKAAPPRQSVPGLNETASNETALTETRSNDTGLKGSPVGAPKPPAQTFGMRINGWPAKFVRPWRIHIR